MACFKVAAKICALPAPVRVLRSGNQRVYAQKKKKKSKFINISSRNTATHHINLQQTSPKRRCSVPRFSSRQLCKTSPLSKERAPLPRKNIAQKPTRNVFFFSVYCGLCLLHFHLAFSPAPAYPNKVKPKLAAHCSYGLKLASKVCCRLIFFLNPPNSGNPPFDSRVKISSACVKKGRA